MSTFGKLDKIDIFNLTLELLGQPQITSAEFTTPTQKATKSIKNVYRITRNSLLREHDWNFARNVVELVEAPDEVTHPGYEYFWYYPDYENLPATGNKPQGAIIVNKVFIDTSAQVPDKIDYKIFQFIDPDESINGKFIATQYDDCYAQITNYGYDDDAGSTYEGAKAESFDATFAETLAYRIAAMICKRITGDKQLTSDLKRDYLERLNEAKRQNNVENNDVDTNVSSCAYIEER